jgi:MFS family permease
MGVIQGTRPNIKSTALVSLTRDLNMQGGQVPPATSIQTISVAASVTTTGLLADRLGRRKVMLAELADTVTSYSSAFTTVKLISAALMLAAGIVAIVLLRNYHEPANSAATATATAPTSDPTK